MELYIFLVSIYMFLLQIIILTCCFKHIMKWAHLIGFEIASIIIFFELMIFYDNLPGYGSAPGLTHFAEVITLLGACILFSAMLVITIFLRIVVFLVKKKKEGKNYFITILIVLSLILIVTSFNLLFYDIQNDLNVGKTTAVIVGYQNNEYGYERPILSYEVAGITYENVTNRMTPELRNNLMGDPVEIFYNKTDPSQFASYSDAEKIYIPCSIISIILLIISRALRKNDLRRKQKER